MSFVTVIRAKILNDKGTAILVVLMTRYILNNLFQQKIEF